MYSLDFLRRKNCIFSALCRPLSRAISSSNPRFKYNFKPFVGNPAKDVEIEEPGCKDDDDALIVIPTAKQCKETVQELKKSFSVWTQDLKDKVRGNADIFVDPDIIYKIYPFSEEGVFEQWKTVCDADEGTGFSSCSLTRSLTGCAIFSGNLSTKVPDDGKSVRSGFCAAYGPRALTPFHTKTYYEWGEYTHIVFKVRGDGRKYLVNVATEGDDELNWHNLYSYPLHTRGGPYWQLTKIPFSKFIFSSRGFIQDTQVPFPQSDVTRVSLAITDDIDGPFQLEIEYIGLENVTSHIEEHAHETYNFDNYFHKI